MAYNNHQQVPFWDFIRSFDRNGAGVDHFAPEGQDFSGGRGPSGAGFPFGGFGGPWGGKGHHWGGFEGFGGPGKHGGPRGPHAHDGPGGCKKGGRGGRRGRREHSGERSRTVSPDPENEIDAERSGEKSGDDNGEGPSSGREGGGLRGPRGFGRRGGHGRFGGRGGWGHHGRRGPPPPPFAGGTEGFDLSGLFEALNTHPVGQQPWAQMLRNYAEQYGLAGGARSGETLVPADTDAENSFIPPIDVFSTEIAYVLHIALPGAKKEDVGVNWDADKGELNIAGVVYRQGDEEFLKTLSKSERKVGVFERSVKLPPGEEEKEEVDGENISAKLEDGILMVTVPKVEKEWTEIKRVDIL